LSYLRPFSL